jgi:serine protease inhibitor
MCRSAWLAAVASAMLGPGAAPREEAVEGTVDRLLIFLIRDIKTGAILSFGCVADPKA